MRKRRVLSIVYWCVMASFVLPIAYTVYKVIKTPNTLILEEFDRSKADYTLMLLQCVLGISVINIPSVLAKKFRFEMPVALYITYIVFLYGAIFLGEIRNFYNRIPFWDDILHGMSSMMTGLFGFMFVEILNRVSKKKISLSPVFIALFAFCFSVTIGAVWEIYEFLADGFFGLNMQKFITPDGVIMIGHEAISDTMKDIIVDCSGALIATLVGYISIKNRRGWIHEYLTNEKEL